MEREILRFEGRLNKDDKLLPKGDYSAARNIIKGVSETGAANTIKKVRSIVEAADLGGAGTVVAATIDLSDNIYAVYRVDATDAKVVRINAADDSVDTIITYNHGSCSIDPDIVIVGDILVWNYYGSGTPLSWWTGRSLNAASVAMSDLSFIKPLPVGLSLTAQTSGDGQREFIENKWDFSIQYVFDSGEVSAISSFLTVLPEEDRSVDHYGIDGIGSVLLNAGSTHPAYATQIIFYARANDASWRRVTTQDVGTNTLTFTGLQNEALDSEQSSKLFDAIPLSATTVELIKNRIFLGNIVDDLGTDASDVTITPNSSNTELEIQPNSLAAHGQINAPISYLNYTSWPTANAYSGIGLGGMIGSSDAVSPIHLSDQGTWAAGSNTPTLPTPSGGNTGQWYEVTGTVSSAHGYSGVEAVTITDGQIIYSDGTEWKVVDTLKTAIPKREVLTNNSLYYVGVQFYDAYGRTRGVEDYVEFKTGNFTYPFAIENVNIAGTTIPSWAVYYEVVVSDNLTKNYSVEGFGSAVGYRIEEYSEPVGVYSIQNFALESDRVSDILVKISEPYNFQEGDRININLSAAAGDRTIRDLKINAYESGVLYLDPPADGFGDLNANQASLHYEIYSPSEKTDDPIFRGTGLIRPVSAIDGTNETISPEIHDSFMVKKRVPLADGNRICESGFGTVCRRGEIAVSASSVGSSTYTELQWDTDYEESPSSDVVTDRTSNRTAFLGVSVDRYLKLRVNVRKVEGTGSPKLSIRLENETAGTFTYLAQDVAWEDIQEVYEYSIDAATTATDYSVEYLLVKTDAGDTSSIVIEAGTHLSLANKVDVNQTELNSLSGDFNYFLARSMTKLKRADDTTWRKHAGKPTVLYESRPIRPKTNKWRWGGKFVVDSKFNPISSFYFSDQAEVPIEAGSLTALRRASSQSELGTVLLAICERETYSVYVEERMLSDSSGATQLIASDDVIGSINPLKGGFGSKHKKSIVSNDGRVLFWDDLKKDWVRYSNEGLQPLGKAYKMLSELSQKTIGASETAVGFYDPFHGMYFLGFTGEAEMLGFRDTEGFTAHFDMICDLGTPYINRFGACFKGTKLYKTLDNGGADTFNSLLGSAVNSSIKLPFITPTQIRPTALGVKTPLYRDYTNADNLIRSGVFSMVVTNDNGQQTTVPSNYFIYESGISYGDVLMDENSAGGILNGIELNGTYHEFNLSLTDSAIDDQIEYILLNYLPIFGL